MRNLPKRSKIYLRLNQTKLNTKANRKGLPWWNRKMISLTTVLKKELIAQKGFKDYIPTAISMLWVSPATYLLKIMTPSQTCMKPKREVNPTNQQAPSRRWWTAETNSINLISLRLIGRTKKAPSTTSTKKWRKIQ